MNSEKTEVGVRIEKIAMVFLNTQLFYATHEDKMARENYLLSIGAEFRSVAYESASMTIAIDCIENKANLQDWLSFTNHVAFAHMAQACIGLGWAIAKLKVSFSDIVAGIDPAYHYRIADGCGYYDGNFRKKTSVLNQQLPEYMPEQALAWYDQGIGRSLWYTGKGDADILINRISAFAGIRRADLWRGAGTAIAYVGGCDRSILKKLFEKAGANGKQLAMGAALAAKSRTDAGTKNADTDNCAQLWFDMIESNGPGGVNDEIFGVLSYEEWIILTENKLADAFAKTIST